MKKTFFIFFLAFVSLYKAQILDEYHDKQTFYEGGMVNFYKDVHEFLINSKLKECDVKKFTSLELSLPKDLKLNLLKIRILLILQETNVHMICHGKFLEILKNGSRQKQKAGKLELLPNLFYTQKI